MIDAEVARLRRLRDVALWTRAVARSLEGRGRPLSVFSRCARTGWTIARVVSGRLRAHPFVSYQRDASSLRAIVDGVGANLIGHIARRRGRALSTCLEQVQIMARELDDARAVTWSPDLSDTLGRVQAELRRLLAELEARAQQETGALPVVAQQPADRSATTDWPYLAI